MVAAENDGATDTGTALYAGTLKLVVSADACGGFTFAIDTSPIPWAPGSYWTYLEGTYPEYEEIYPNGQPLSVNTCPDDGILCNGTKACDPVLGCVTVPVNCDDGVACTIDSCDAGLDKCVHKPNHALCDDGNPRTIDKCTLTGCTHWAQRPLSIDE